ncbi:hypothetical protein [Roseospira navarrensis]|uniref:Uncharacterized protein n=1 Tax=Roseospira navarrensis TaxID=140058 RepID=A0A7X2D314_9PROT|nr:hypothetical protein [Roseospira navarrensis]MQX36834.1 hypothetical protein [Roseospira navarrensis]
MIPMTPMSLRSANRLLAALRLGVVLAIVILGAGAVLSACGHIQSTVEDGGVIDARLDQRWPADTQAQRAYRLAALAAPALELVYDTASGPALRPGLARDVRAATCEAAHGLIDGHAAIAEGSAPVIVLGAASRGLRIAATYAAGAASPAAPVTVAVAAVKLADALERLPGTVIDQAVGLAVLRDVVAHGRDPTDAEWRAVLAPARALVEGCGG